jgi:FKBP-type peptidyl-prolyl cis-trans isomerase FkpA
MKHQLFSLALILAVVAPFVQAGADVVPVGGAAAVGKSLVKIDNVVGTGAEAGLGLQVQVNYTGWLYDPNAIDNHGKKFDSSVGREAFEFQLGAKQVIKGWDQGVLGMKVGGKRTLIIPGDLAYGKRGAGNGLIPPDAILVFDIELLNVK